MGKFLHNDTSVPQPLPALHFHQFPKGSFKACFIPPALPKYVVSHFASHPPTWTWAVKAGPNKGKTFQVPTIPIVCDESAPRAVHWMVMVFHSFKAHLNPITIDANTGRVLPDWLRLYQNNLHIHLHSQLKARPPHSKPAPPTTPTPIGAKTACTHPKPAIPIAAKVDRLWTELHALKEKFYKYIASHEACCHHSNSTSDASEEEAASDGDDPPPPDSTTPPSPSSGSSLMELQYLTATPPNG
ncbi:hypothetical protein BKA83DRAFT_4497333 [Pisolithus microcarpus]|nr:hypothetical protein BKA83DRAFT_4497333 [Pisolithus microcarpus]